MCPVYSSRHGSSSWTSRSEVNISNLVLQISKSRNKMHFQRSHRTGGAGAGIQVFLFQLISFTIKPPGCHRAPALGSLNSKHEVGKTTPRLPTRARSHYQAASNQASKDKKAYRSLVTAYYSDNHIL